MGLTERERSIENIVSMASLVFDWKNYGEWSGPVLTVLGAEITQRLMSLVRSSDVFLADDLEWLNPIRAQAGIKSTADLRKVLADRFRSVFTAIRGYHACRPKNPESYFLHGLRVYNSNEMLEEARMEIPVLIPGTTDDQIRYAHNNVRPDDRAGRVHFTLDDRWLTGEDGASHYLAYGGEYLQALVVRLPGGDSNLALLESTGIPTVLVCDVPLSEVGPELILDLSNHLIGELFRHIRKPIDMRMIDFTMRIEKAVSPNNIVGHYHPHDERSQPECALCSRPG